MATNHHHDLKSKAKRAKLPVRNQPYVEPIGKLALCYFRKSDTQPGVWSVRMRNPLHKKHATLGKSPYLFREIGESDDHQGETGLSYRQAVAVAPEVAKSKLDDQEALANPPAEVAPIYIHEIVTAYIAKQNEKHRKLSGNPKMRSDADYRLTKYVLGDDKKYERHEIADLEMKDLTIAALQNWYESLLEQLDKRASRQRALVAFRAALNFGCRINTEKLPAKLEKIITAGFNVDVLETEQIQQSTCRPDQYIEPGEMKAIMNAAKVIDDRRGWDGDLYLMTRVLAITGARFSQIARLTVGDVNRKTCEIHIPNSRKGRNSAKQFDHRTRKVPQSLINELDLNRPKTDPLLVRREIVRTGFGEWKKGEKVAWKASPQFSPYWGEIIEEAKLGRHVIAYALRHTSIINMLLTGELKLLTIAQRHDTGVNVIEKHYGFWLSDQEKDEPVDYAADSEVGDNIERPNFMSR